MLTAAVFFLLLLAFLSDAHAFFWSTKKDEAVNVGTEFIAARGVACEGADCPSLSIQIFDNGEWENGQSVELTAGDCATKANIGTIVCPRTGHDDDCTLYSAWGTVVSSCAELRPADLVYVVPRGRLFMWPSHDVGHRAEIKHVPMPDGRAIVLETLSQRPRVFRLQNFFTEAEAEGLIEHALSIQDDSHRLKRSSTGATGYTVDSKRTSEGAFDTNSEIALAIKRRSFDVLGIRPYDESFSDGIQVLRYNQTTAYIAHMDWIEPTKLNNDHNWESAGEGTNRYATILLYLSGVEDGGETVFTQAKPIGEGARVIPKKQAEEETTSYLDSKNITELFPTGTWQRNMIVECRSRMAIKPVKAEAVLFYSQFPDGRVDRLSVHGGCPVLIGQKWAANLWVWNGPRNGYPQRGSGAVKSEKPTSVSAAFTSEVSTPHRLFWEDTDWGALQPGADIRVNTFAGHKWNIRLNGEKVLTWVIAQGETSQRFVFRTEDLKASG